MVALVVLPGLDASGTLHDDFLDAARSTFDSACVLSYPPEELDYRSLETWVRARLPSDTPFVLLGESFSGPIATVIAADPPPRLCGLVLSASFASKPVRWLAPFAPLVRAAPLPVPSIQALSPILLGRWATRHLEAALDDAVRSVPSRLLRFRASLALRADMSSLLHRIAVPSLCLRATEDRLLSNSCSGEILASIPCCIGRDIEGPHLLLQAQAAACAMAVVDFVNHIALPNRYNTQPGLPVTAGAFIR